MRPGATIHPFKQRGSRSEISDLHFVFRIDNYLHLTAAFGPAVAHQTVDVVCRILGDLFGGGGLVMRDGDGLISGFLWDRAVLGGGPLDRACARFVQAVAAALATRPIHAECQVVHVSVSGAWSTPESGERKAVEPDRGGGASAALTRIPIHGEAPGGLSWGRRYRCDMADAADLFALLNEGHVRPAWQAVRSAEGEILYQQCVLRAVGREEVYASPPRLVPALERLGFIQALDHHVVNQVVAELEAHPSVALGVNISTLSARLDGWWVNLVERLRRRPDVARRLIVEISDTAPLPSVRDAVIFAERLRKLGCRIAAESFGGGNVSIRQLRDLRPDIVKIAPFFLQRAQLSDGDRRALHHIIGLAGALAPVVIMGGVDTDDLADVARVVGMRWQQGSAVSGARIPRPWLAAGERSHSSVRHDLRPCAPRLLKNGERAS